MKKTFFSQSIHVIILKLTQITKTVKKMMKFIPWWKLSLLSREWAKSFTRRPLTPKMTKRLIRLLTKLGFLSRRWDLCMIRGTWRRIMLNSNRLCSTQTAWLKNMMNSQSIPVKGMDHGRHQPRINKTQICQSPLIVSILWRSVKACRRR